MWEKGYFLSRLKKIYRMLDNYIEHDLNIFQKILILIDLGFSMLLYGAGITDYFQYQFYKRRHIDRKDFIVYRKRMWLVKNFNDSNDRKVFDSKAEFNKIFDIYIHRRWLNILSATFDEFQHFANEVKTLITKPIEGSHGIGIKVLKIDSEVDLREIYERLIAEQSIIEELIVQNDELAEFNPTSVNTLRVVTLISASGKVNIMTANLRVGNGERFADNFHHNGIAALIDLKTGLVITSGIDKDFKRYIVHPISGKQIIGFKIPYWEKVMETVEQVAQVVPTVRYVGWDVAICKDGQVSLVEGNAAADPDVSQMPDQVGKWPLYRNIIMDIGKTK